MSSIGTQRAKTFAFHPFLDIFSKNLAGTLGVANSFRDVLVHWGSVAFEPLHGIYQKICRRKQFEKHVAHYEYA